MNEVGIALAWLAIQVTLVGLFAAGVYVVARRIRPAAAPTVVLSGLVSVVVLSLLAPSGWPRWSFLTPPSLMSPNARAVAASELPEPGESTGISPQAGAPADAAIDLPSRRPVSAESADADGLLPIWQAFLDELSRPAALRETSHRRWPVLISWVFALVGGGAVLWLTAGLIAVRGYRRRSRPLKDAELAAEIERLRKELDCRRPIEIRQTDELVTAATIGWRSPVLLLPPAWRAWTASQRRAVLAHEIAHVRSGDFLSILVGQLGLVLHFYHPLVHWLMGRLRLEQELAADAAAAAVSGGQRAYLTAIAELALHQPHQPMGWPARSFLPTRTTFLRRIAMLRDSKLRHQTLSPPTKTLAVGLIVIFGLFIAGLRGPAADQAALAEQVEPAKTQETTAPDAVPQAPGKEGAVPTDGIDLTYVPQDAALIMAIRPAALLSRPELAEFAPLLQVLEPIRNSMIPVEDLRQATVVAKLPLESETLVLQTSRPHDFEEFARRFAPNAKPVQYKGKTFDASPSHSPVVLYRPDDRTAVLASEAVVKAMIDGNTGRLPGFIEAGTWKEFQGDQLLVAADPAIIRTLTGRMGVPPGASPLGPLMPLLQSTSSLILGVGIGDRIDVHGVAFCNDREAAKEVQQTLDALAVLGRNLSKDMQDAFVRDPRGPRGTGEAKLAVLMLQMTDRLLENVKIEREKKTVRLTTSVGIDALPGKTLADAIVAAQSAAKRTQSTNNLKQIALAMHMFHDTYKRLPPAAPRASKTRQPMEDYPPHSWRVAILPFVEGQHLYEQYRFDEPWDSPANLKLLDQMPAVFRSPTDPPGTTETGYFALVGPGTAFSVEGGTSFMEIRDGTSNSLLIVEAKRAVPWTKPEDIPYDPQQPIPELGGHFEGGFLTAFCDGSVRFIAHSIDKKVLRALIDINDGQTIPPGSY